MTSDSNYTLTPCLYSSYDEPHTTAEIVTILAATAFCSVNAVFATANLKFNKSLSPLGRLITTAFFVNSGVPWVGRLLHLLIRETLGAHNTYVCVILGMLFVITMHFQAFLLSIIAYDRFLIITSPLNYRSHFFQKRPLLLFFICLGIPLTLVVTTAYSPEGYCIDINFGCFYNGNTELLSSLVSTAGAFAIQLACSIWYIVSYVRIWRASRKAAQASSITGRRRRTALRTFAIIGIEHVVFTILPTVFAAICMSTLNVVTGTWLYRGIFITNAGNEIIAPITYVIFDSCCRAAAKRLIHCKSCLPRS